LAGNCFFRTADCCDPKRNEAEPQNRQQAKRKENMNNKFDELTKQMAQSVTRRAALKKFGVGLAGMALACFGLANKAEAGNGCKPSGSFCTQGNQCCSGSCAILLGAKRGRCF